MLRAVGVTGAIVELRGGTLWVLDHRSRLSPCLGRKAAVAATTYPATPHGQFLNSFGILQRVGAEGREEGEELQVPRRSETATPCRIRRQRAITDETREQAHGHQFHSKNQTL